MSSGEVDFMVAAVEYADFQFDGAPFAGMTADDIDRRYAQWIVEYLHDHAARICMEEPDAKPGYLDRTERAHAAGTLCVAAQSRKSRRCET